MSIISATDSCFQTSELPVSYPTKPEIPMLKSYNCFFYQIQRFFSSKFPLKLNDFVNTEPNLTDMT